MRYLILLLGWVSGFTLMAQDLVIPDSLLNGSNQVAIHDHTVFEVEDIHSSTLKRNYRALILNKKAWRFNHIILHYDKFQTVASAQVKVLDLLGNERKSFKLKDFDDKSLLGISIASDSRYKELEITDDDYPYIIEVSYAINYQGSLFYPDWEPQPWSTGVVNATLEVKSAIDDAFRYKSRNVEPEVLQEGKHVRWEVTNLAPIGYEPFAAEEASMAPYVATAPNAFQMDDYEGDFSSWESFGQWIAKLNAGKSDLTESQINEVRKLIPENATKEERARIVYDFMQQNSRYVSIQLGIGGWQPFPASFVHVKKYGDCKALSFYTKALLEHVDVDAHYTLIRAGKNADDIDPTFPISQFNHAILTVPLDQDTVWLECTSSTNPFGYLGKFTSDRNALMITEDGAEIVRTRSYAPEDNQQFTRASLLLTEGGSVSMEVERKYRGLSIENDNLVYIIQESDVEQEKWARDNLSWGNFENLSFEVTAPTEEVVPEMHMTVTAQSRSLVKKTGSRLFLPASPLTEIPFRFKSKDRETALQIRYPVMQTDTLKISLPENYHMETSDLNMDLNSSFGDYSLRSEVVPSGIVVIRSFKMKSGTYTKQDYLELKEFLDQVHKADNKRLVFASKT